MRRLLTPALLGLGLACTGQEVAPPSEADGAGGEWVVQVAAETGHKLGGCAVGDLLQAFPGPEIAAVGEGGQFVLAHRTADGAWAHQTVFQAPGEMIQCAIGDADPSSPGPELIGVGMAQGGESDGGPGKAWILHAGEDGWQAQELFEDSALIHAVCVGQGEVFVAGFSRRLVRLRPPAGESLGNASGGDSGTSAEGGPGAGAASWQSEVLCSLPGDAKSALWTPSGVVVACTDGSLVRVAADGSSSVVHHAAAGRARLGTDGPRILAADDGGDLVLIDGTAEARVLHHEQRKLRGAVLADLDGTTPGIEAATAGYAGSISVLRETGGEWKATTVHEGSDAFHHLASGELIADCPGVELVACGYSGRVLVIGRAR